jgi:hypothetical protein
MKRQTVFRGFLIAAGLLAAAVIIWSHSFHPTESKKASVEQSENPDEQPPVLSAPSEAITQASVVKIDEQVPDLLLEIIEVSDHASDFIPVAEQVVNTLFQVLFRIVIAPNAP